MIDLQKVKPNDEVTIVANGKPARILYGIRGKGGVMVRWVADGIACDSFMRADQVDPKPRQGSGG